MLRSIKDIIGYPLESLDGPIGKVKSCLFDDQSWRIRYLVADTGTWLPKKKVLISPMHMKQPQLGNHQKRFPIELTKRDIENCPELDTNAPISRRYELEFASYYNHALYWDGPYAWGPYATPVYTPPSTDEDRAQRAKEHAERVRDIESSHLRSASEVIGYEVEASDGEFGYVQDLIMNDEHWNLQYAVVNTRKWLPGRSFLVDIDWIQDLDWNSRTAKVALSQEQIKSSPEFDPNAPVNHDYLDHLYDYYGKPHPELEAEHPRR